MSDVVAAHAHSSNHRDALLRSATCGCFYCLAVFAPDAIREWTDIVDEGEEARGTTAFCPKCEIDSVIASSSGYPITKEFLAKMRSHWFRSK
jgi:hypothetical protein